MRDIFRFLMLFAITVLILIGVFLICFYAWILYIDVISIRVEKLDEEPDDYFVVMSEDNIDQFPSLKRAISMDKSQSISKDEFNRLRDFLGENNSYIQYQNEYYWIMFGTP